MTLRVLVTGFGPYGKTKINPSLAVVQNLQENVGVVHGVEIVARQVSSEFFKCIEETQAFIEELSPDAVIMLGEYPGRSMITVERTAINYNDATRYDIKDEAGFAPQGTPVVEGGPTAYFSTLPLRRLVRDLRANGIPADISGDAGTLMCNHLLYGILHHVNTKAARDADGRAIPSGWIHLPALPEMAALDENLGMPSMTAELSTKAIICAIQSVLEDEIAGGVDIDDPIKSRLLV